MTAVTRNDNRSFLTSVRAVVLAALVAAMILLSATPAGAATVAGPGTAITPDVGSTVAVTGFSVAGIGGGTVTIEITSNSGTLALTVTSGVTVDPSSTANRLVVSGNETDLNAALAGLEYTRVGAGSDTISVAVPEENMFECAVTGHSYKLVESTTDWDSARNASAAAFGGNGYLVTVTSDAENQCVFAGIAGFATDARDTWIGAHMVAATPYAWEWATGPELGTQFWVNGSGGSPVGGQFNFWDTVIVQPDTDMGQQCAQYYNSASALPTWHDNGCATANKYVIEVPPQFVITPSASVQVLALPAATALANSGVNGSVGLAVGVVIAAAGAILLWLNRRRRHA